VSDFQRSFEPGPLQSYSSLGELFDVSVGLFGSLPFIEYADRYITYNELAVHVD
jgi:hypothetical protein